MLRASMASSHGCTVQRTRNGRHPLRAAPDACSTAGAGAGAVATRDLGEIVLRDHRGDEVWRAAPDVTEERHTAPGASDPSVIVARQGGGLGRVIRLSTVTAAYLSVADGALTPRQAVGAIAGILDLDAEEATREVLALVREAAKDGLLVRPAG